MELKEHEFLDSLLVLKALCGHIYTKEMVLNQCDKFGFRSYNVCVELYEKGYWNGKEEISIVNTIIDIIENHPSFGKENIKNYLKRYKITIRTDEFEKLYKYAKERWMNNQGKIGNSSKANKGTETEKVIEKLNEGKSQREVAKELGITRSAVQYHLRKEKTMEKNKEIQVLHPSHYNTRSYECWDVFKEIAEQNNMSPAESALFFNVFKYVWRYKSKDGVKDLEKAKNYIDELIKILGE